MNNKITFVSLGPGDPELITLKGFRILKESDVILCPATKGSDGELLSRAKDIVEALGVDISKVECFVVPMSRDRRETLLRYEDVARKAFELQKSGLKVAITAEGDAGFYSSSQYVEEFVWGLGGESCRVAGVPAFIDCARRANTHVVNQDSSFEVMARVESAEALLCEMSKDKSIVLMKISQWEAAIKEAIARSTSHDFYYIESCGVDAKEFFSRDKQEIIARKFPYFAILIIKATIK
ncbi:MAG: precorrin-2 C(20)-methyltransferase [Rikenellaceae bacterium]